MIRRLYFILALLLIVTQGWATVVTGDCGPYTNPSSVKYSYDTDTKVLTISGTGAMKNYATVSGTPGFAPWYSSYKTVIKTVIIESGVTSIGSNAFYSCSAITSVTIPSTVTTIGNSSSSGNSKGGAFKGCTSLADVYLYTNPASLTYYGPDDFKSSNATTCHVPDSYYSTYTSSFSSMNVTFSKNGPTGLSDDPYLIGTFSAWNTFAEKVNKGIQPEACAKLTAAISGVATSVGTEDHPYTGTFDGQGKNLTNVSISGSTNVGLFGYVNGGTIKNVVLKSGTVSATDINVGGIVGNLYSGTVQYCANYATVSSSYNGSARCGGIVGHMYNIDANNLAKTVTRCVNFGNVSAVNYAGGIVGSIGYGSITYCQNYGTISTSSTSARFCGGVVGYFESGNTLTNNHNGGTVSRAQSGATTQFIKGNTSSDVDASNTYLHSMTLTVAGTSYTGDALSAYRGGATCVYDNPSGIAISGTTYSGPTPTYVNFTLSYTLNGGTVSSANPTTYNYGTSTFTLRNPTKTGYTFAGWTGTGLASATTTVTITKGSTGNRSYTANWTANTYYVSFNKNASDATGTMSNESFTYGTSKALTSNTFTRTGYTFAGWATTSVGSVVYSDGQSVNNLTSTAEGTVTLFAKWTANTYTVVFNKNATGVYGTMNNESFTYGISKALTTNVYTRTGYDFAGWATASGGSVVYSDGQSVSNLTSTAGGTVNLFAKWTARTYTVTFDKQGGTGGSNSVTVTYESAMPPATMPTRAHYTFGGYYTSTGGSGTQYYTATGTSARSWDNTYGTTLYAKWTACPTATVTAPTAKSLTYTGTAQALVNAGSSTQGTIQYKLNDGSWDTSIPTATDAGTYTVYYQVVADDNHTDNAGSSVSVTIDKAASSITAVPTAKSLVYNGSAQTLINAGTASGGTMNYSFNNSTWSSSLPTATSAGEYTVYYKVVGDGNHNNTSVSSIKAYIDYTITYDLNGSSVASANPTRYNVTTATFTLNNPTRTGYTFAGWTGTGLSSATTSVTIAKGSTGNRTYTANWTRNAVTLTDGEGISALSPYAGQQCDVTYSRSFTSGKPSTVCLPFAYTKKEGDGSFYAFTNIEKEGSNYVATMKESSVSTLTANTPYLYMPSATSSVDFSGTYTIPASLTAGSTISGNWTYLGTYETVAWTEAPTGIYGFSAQNVDEQGISQGQFVKVGAYVRVKPMRCYLKYKNGSEDFTGARSTNSTVADEELPETISVRLVSATGEVDAIGTLQTTTGDVTIDTENWFDLSGRRLSGHPAEGTQEGRLQGKKSFVRGIYVCNGKKYIIK